MLDEIFPPNPGKKPTPRPVGEGKAIKYPQPKVDHFEELKKWTKEEAKSSKSRKEFIAELYSKVKEGKITLDQLQTLEGHFDLEREKNCLFYDDAWV